MKNIDYIRSRSSEREDYSAAILMAFYHSLSPTEQEVIEDIFCYNGHTYYTTVCHTLNKFHYTDDDQGVSFNSENQMQMYLDGIDPVERTIYPLNEPENLKNNDDTTTLILKKKIDRMRLVLERANEFILGFEDDEEQEGIAELCEDIKDVLNN